MGDKINVAIYGDSIMRGTVIDGARRYHATISDHLARLAGLFGLEINNKARFGSTAERGKKQLEQDLRKGLACEYALLEYGGNDCSFNWEQVAANPLGEHLPFTPPERFRRAMTDMVGGLLRQGVAPVLMTLPPIDARRHLRFIGKDSAARKSILRWLGDVHMIYRFHEMYSNSIAQVAQFTGSILVDVRQRFLSRHDMTELVGIDGVHPSAEGYRLLGRAFSDFIAGHRQRPGQLVFC